LWCQSLGLLTSVSVDDAEADLKLAAYVPMLADRFPAGAFTTRSLEHVAAKAIRGFPTYGELALWLGEWWRDHRPPLPTLAYEPIKRREEPDEAEKAAIHATVQEAIAALRSPFSERDNRPPPPEPKPSYLSPEQLDKLNPLPNGMKRHAE
jgi:hypothetical protein